MVEDLLIWKLNKARLLLAQDNPEAAYLLLETLAGQALGRDSIALQMQFFSVLSEAAKQLGWYNSSIEWLLLVNALGQREEANLNKQISKSEKAGLTVR